MIDKRAVIEQGAEIDEGVSVGAYAVISGKAKIGAGTYIGPHAVIDGKTTIGKDNKIFQFAAVGAEPIDRSYKGEESQVVIGDNNVIREYSTIHGGTPKEEGVTRIGSHNFIMNYVHIGHDCQIGDHVHLVNYAGIAGHVHIDDHAYVGVYCGVHQFAHLGAHCFVIPTTMISKDVPPYIMVTGGLKATPCGVNIEGLKRRGFTQQQISNIRMAYKILYRRGLRVTESAEEIRRIPQVDNELSIFVDMLETSQRGLVR